MMGSAANATLIIDHFDSKQIVTATGANPIGAAQLGTTLQVADANVLTGYRDVLLNVTSTAGSAGVYINTDGTESPFISAYPGQMAYANGPDADSIVVIQWDGDDNPAAWNPAADGGVAGLSNLNLTAAPVDLTLDASMALMLNVVSNDLGATVVMRAYENTAADYAEYAFALSGGQTGDFVAPYSAWSRFGAFGAGDFANVRAMTLTIDGNPELDFTLHAVTSVVPEPSSMALLGLGAVALVRRRRRKAA
jgi:hypothetical protein